jgi:DNA-binding NarL/FixJ family response regulator
MIRLLIAEDHTVVRRGLEELLRAAGDVEIVGSAADGVEAVELVARRPDVVLMDLEMPRMDGVAATRAIAAGDSGARVVVLTSFSDRERILDALDAGATGYLLKDAEPEELLRGVRAAAAGDSPLDPKVAGTLLAAHAQRRPAAGLSARQQAVLALVGRGLPNKLIARELEISEKTVKAHLTAIFQALGVTDRTQAALWAQRHGVA